MREKFLFLFLIVVTLAGCTNNSLSTDSSAKEGFSNETCGLINYEYEELEDKLVYWDDVPNINLNHYYVYFFSRTCSHCERIRNLVIPNLLHRRIFYACEASNQTKICGLQPKGSFDEIDFCILGFPTIVEVKDWCVVKYVNGENEVLSFLNTK